MVNKTILTTAANEYGFNADTLQFISDSTNQVYRFQKDGVPYILRISQRPLEFIDQITAEMDWIDYLAQNHVSVPAPLYTDGRLAIPVIDEDKPYILTSFEFVKGCCWDKSNPDKWNTRIFYNWGKTMGKMHCLTKRYTPPKGHARRTEFTGRDALSSSIENCPTVYAITQDLIRDMITLPKSTDTYGLIHYDLHPWNFYIDGDVINVFDFDDSLYGWYASDIGIALYHGLWWGRPNDPTGVQRFAEDLITSFIAGYRQNNDLPADALRTVPMFIKFRQICKFSWFFDAKNIDDEQKEQISNIENGLLFENLQLDHLLFE